MSVYLEIVRVKRCLTDEENVDHNLTNCLSEPTLISIFKIFIITYLLYCIFHEKSVNLKLFDFLSVYNFDNFRKKQFGVR